MNTACCMRPDCGDTHCPGRAMAREVLFKDGGRKVVDDDFIPLHHEPVLADDRLYWGRLDVALLLLNIAGWPTAAWIAYLTLHH